ncbi:RNA-binding protein 12B [Microcaecilia unicolor]|uniref:RNA-binding protein 12B-like n=1 Tax=Microcaecilia unicolor TaxID=1415580 RepID=A0A6P7Z6W1_9AMPH|nr:RNA-binding protein 12B-like [Microcaecilia unicolor]XP_030072360.1 RNA-binding protein 12B-like [Microcaecilia unicolor]
MAVIIRLQGLPVSAGSADIRHFFTGLTIPDGGVHIFGGELGEAFITFATDEDARRAMSRSGGSIKQSTIQLYLSSKTQMQNILEMNRKRKEHGEREPVPGTRRHGSKIPSASRDENLSDLVASDKRVNKIETSPTSFYSWKRRNIHHDSDERYLFVRGMPYLATFGNIEEFFHGLRVVGVIFLLHQTGPKIGLRSGKCLVKFASSKDALEGLKLDKHFFLGKRFIQISRTTKNQWDRLNSENMTVDRFALKNEESTQSGERSQSLEQNFVHSKDKRRSRSPRKERQRSRSPQNPAFYIHMKNLSHNVGKKDIRLFFRNLDLSDDQIKFLQYSYKNRSKDGFVMLKSERDYRIALSFHKCVLNNRRVYIYPIAQKSMLELLEKVEFTERMKSEYVPDSRCQDTALKPRLYIYVKNFPFDVTKAEVQKFFVGFSLNDEDIYLLYDEKGVGLGEALVMFHSEEHATHVENLNCQRFLGAEVLLQRISEAQLKKFGINAFPGESSAKIQDRSPLYCMDHYSLSDSSCASSVQSFEVPHLRHSSEESRNLCSHMDFGSRFDMQKHGSEGNPERRISVGGNSSGPIVIRLKNIPFTTTVNEILDFFYGYWVIPDSVSIHHESGFPTGIATVAMESADEAIAAVRELHGRPVGPRRVKLSLA